MGEGRGEMSAEESAEEMGSDEGKGKDRMEHAEMIKKRDREKKSEDREDDGSGDAERGGKREHEMTHVPYRSWCRHCVRGRGKEMNHKKSEGQPTMTEIHMDLCFPGEEDGSGSLTVLVARDRVTRMTMSTVLPSKTKGVFIVKRVVAFMR